MRVRERHAIFYCVSFFAFLAVMCFVYFVSLICDCMSDGCACCIIVMHICLTASQSEACSSDDPDFRVAFVV